MSYFVIKNDKDLYLKSHGSSYTTTSAAYLAVKLDEKRADNILKCLPRALQPFGFYKEEVEEEDAKMFSTTEEPSTLSWVTNPVCVEEYLKDTLLRLSEVNAYLEYESKRLRNFDMQILDMRHYLRDEETKLNATQLCRFAKKLQELERQRRDCKMDICRLDLLTSYPNKLLTGELLPMLEGLSKPYNYRVLSKREINEMLGIENRECACYQVEVIEYGDSKVSKKNDGR